MGFDSTYPHQELILLFSRRRNSLYLTLSWLGLSWTLNLHCSKNLINQSLISSQLNFWVIDMVS